MVDKFKIMVIFTLTASVANAAAGNSVPAGVVISQLANISILALILYFWQRKAIAEVFKQKKESFLQSVNEASKSKSDAEKTLAEVTQRVKGIQTTFQKQIEEAKVNAEETYQAHLNKAKEEAQRLKSMAQSTLEYEVQKQVENLRVETFQKSAGLAEKNLEETLTPDQLKAWTSHFVLASEGAH